jgi:predicted metal-dependent hydrolase
MSLVEPSGPWTELLERGREPFNRGDYFAAHERWEEGWRETRGADRVVMQGLIQIAAGLHQLQRSRVRPATSLLRKGLAKLGTGPALREEPRLGALTAKVASVIESLTTSGTADLESMKL